MPSDERDQEDDRQHVGEGDGAGEVPVHLLERHAEDAREEQEARDPPHPTTCSSRRASSSDACAPRHLRPPVVRSGVPSSVPACHFRVQVAQRGGHPRDVVGRDDDRRRRPRGSGSPRRRPAARRRGSAARRRGTRTPSRERTPLPRPPASGMSRSSASESRCSSSERRRGAYGISSSRSPSAASRPTRGRTSGSRRGSGRRRRRGPTRSSAVRNGRGSRLPKNEPVCVSRKRSDGVVLEPGEVVEVGAVRDRHDPPRAVERSRISSAIASETHDDRVGVARDQPRDRVLALLLRAHEQPLGAPVRVRDERVAQVGDPLHAGRLLHRRADQVHRRRRRGREHDVDPLAAHDADRGRDRGQVPADVLVGDEQPAAGELRLPRRRARAPASRAAPRRACAPSARGSARGAPRRASAAAARRRGGSTSGRRARARASRCRARADASRTSAAAARRRRPRAGSRG